MPNLRESSLSELKNLDFFPFCITRHDTETDEKQIELNSRFTADALFCLLHQRKRSKENGTILNGNLTLKCVFILSFRYSLLPNYAVNSGVVSLYTTSSRKLQSKIRRLKICLGCDSKGVASGSYASLGDTTGFRVRVATFCCLHRYRDTNMQRHYLLGRYLSIPYMWSFPVFKLNEHLKIVVWECVMCRTLL